MRLSSLPTRYIVRRAIYALIALGVIIVINFFLPRLLPGSPADILASGSRLGALKAAELTQEFGLNQPIQVQFLKYLEGLFQLNFGDSYEYQQPVYNVVMSRLPWTIFLIGTATVITAIIGLVIGLVSAYHHGKKLDLSNITVSMILWTVPYFWIAMIMLWFFGVDLGWFPMTNNLSFNAATEDAFKYFLDVISHAALPIISIVITTYAQYMLIMRSTTLDVIREDFVTVARAKGLTTNRILFRHVAKNAILPMITMIALNLGYVVSGAILVEIVFTYPGVGLLIFQAVETHDYPLIQGTFFILALAVISVNFLADILLAVVDPRIRYR
ncbi:MAG TPA: ABC transporter permease [Nitrososphaerales archaeon]|nr:ABC transporter permease [Nitrososphaerales archaeon]